MESSGVLRPISTLCYEWWVEESPYNINFQIPPRCLGIHLNSDTTYLEIASDPMDLGAVL